MKTNAKSHGTTQLELPLWTMVMHRYVSYLLRMWSTEQGEATCWRASLEDPHTGERFGFASLEELFSFLTEKVEGKNRAESDSSHSSHPECEP